MSNQVKRSIAKLVKVSDRVIRQEHSLEDDYFLSQKQIKQLVADLEVSIGVKAEGKIFKTVIDVENAFYKVTRSIEHKVVAIISSIVCIEMEYISRDSNLVDDLGADSLDAVDLVTQIEQEFKVEISDKEFGIDFSIVRTVQQIIDLVHKKIREK